MSIRATITITLPVSERGHQRRDEIVREFSDTEGVYIDVHSIMELTGELEARAKDGEQRALAVAKKAGLKPVGRPDMSYGLHGSKSGPMTMWFQISAEG